MFRLILIFAIFSGLIYLFKKFGVKPEDKSKKLVEKADNIITDYEKALNSQVTNCNKQIKTAEQAEITKNTLVNKLNIIQKLKKGDGNENK